MRSKTGRTIIGCRNDLTQLIVADTFCEDIDRPQKLERTMENFEGCSYVWIPGAWDVSDVECTQGQTQHRKIYCLSSADGIINFPTQGNIEELEDFWENSGARVFSEESGGTSGCVNAWGTLESLRGQSESLAEKLSEEKTCENGELSPQALPIQNYVIYGAQKFRDGGGFSITLQIPEGKSATIKTIYQSTRDSYGEMAAHISVDGVRVCDALDIKTGAWWGFAQNRCSPANGVVVGPNSILSVDIYYKGGFLGLGNTIVNYAGIAVDYVDSTQEHLNIWEFPRTGF